MAKRRKAREAVLKALYLAESRGMTAVEAFAEMESFDRIMSATPDENAREELAPFSLGLDGEQMEFATTLAYHIERSQDDYNDQIRAVLKNWDLERIARIDRIIMWIALAEMTHILDIPVTVSINEAVELAKIYSFPKSPGFINGVLDAVARSRGLIEPRKQ